MSKFPRPLSFLLPLVVLGLAACERKAETLPEALPAKKEEVPAAAPANPAPAPGTPLPSLSAVLKEKNARQDKIEAKVRQMIADRLKLPLDQVVPEARIKRDLHADDLNFVQLIMAFEEEFNVTITDEYAVKIETAGDAVKILIWLGAR